MRTFPLLALLFAALAVPVFAATVFAAAVFAADGGKGDGARIESLFDEPTRDVRSLQGLTAGPTAELVAGSGISLEATRTLRRYHVNVDGELGDYTVAFLDVEMPRVGAIRVGTAMSPKGRVRAAHAFDDYGKVLEQYEPFLKQFVGPRGLRPSEKAGRPIGDVINDRDRILLSDDPPKARDDKRAWTLVRHHSMMWELENRFVALQNARSDGDGLRGPLRDVDEQLAALHAFATHLKSVMKPKGVGQYRKKLAELRELGDKATELVERERRDDAAKLIKGDMKLSCGRCHGSDQNQWRKPLEGKLREMRESIGFGPGNFLVGLDVRPVDLPDDEAQMLANTVKGLLIVSLP